MTEQFYLVELDNGEQEFFDAPYYAFRFAKVHEDARRGSVEYVAIGTFDDDEGDDIVYTGQWLRLMLRALDNEMGWIEAVAEALNERETCEDDTGSWG